MNIDYIKSLFIVDIVTGIITWNERPRSHFNSNKGFKGFNTRYKGNEAGSITTHPKTGKQYKRIKIDGKSFSVHRIMWLFYTGGWPNNGIDHIDGDSLNNKANNLRDVTVKENLKNKKKYNSNKTGCCGVWLNKNNKTPRWIAYITVNKKRIHLISTPCFDSAVKARKEAEVEYGFHENHGS